MITVTLFKMESAEHKDHASIAGFEFSGHAEHGVSGEDIVCAAVSSAAYMAANTVSDVLHCSISAEVEDGYMKVMLSDNDVPRAQDILEGLKLHMEALTKQYPENITLREV